MTKRTCKIYDAKLKAKIALELGCQKQQKKLNLFLALEYMPK